MRPSAIVQTCCYKYLAISLVVRPGQTGPNTLSGEELVSTVPLQKKIFVLQGSGSDLNQGCAVKIK